MNVITTKTILITYDVWEPMDKAVKKEEDTLLFGVKDKTFLAHAGNVKIVMRDKV